MRTIREAVLTVGAFAALGALIVLLWLGEARSPSLLFSSVRPRSGGSASFSAAPGLAFQPMSFLIQWSR
jgi:hypothetical protein